MGMDRHVNLAVIGSGYWGRKALTEYLQLERVDPRFKLLKICDLKEDNLEYCKNVMHVDSERLSMDYEAVLKSPDIDAVHICTPNETHYKFGSQALNEGKNVLLEKPMALLAKGCLEPMQHG